MPHRHFKDDDAGYTRWALANPRGVAVNTERTPSAGYLVAHRAQCSSFWNRGTRMTYSYAKHAFSCLGEANAHFEALGLGRPTTDCPHCHVQMSQPTVNWAEFEQAVEQLLEDGVGEDPPGNLKPPKVETPAGTVYVRDPEVAARVLELAGGVCEFCREAAPFERRDGRAYLEVHHVQYLSREGSDTVDNAVAVCPNCHRGFHSAADRDQRRDKAYTLVDRLQRVGPA